MKLNMFAYLYSKPLGNHSLNIMKKYYEFTLKTWKNHGNIMEFCQSEKVGTLLSGSLVTFASILPDPYSLKTFSLIMKNSLLRARLH